jgi:hypothetical protein
VVYFATSPPLRSYASFITYLGNDDFLNIYSKHWNFGELKVCDQLRQSDFRMSAQVGAFKGLNVCDQLRARRLSECSFQVLRFRRSKCS